MGKSDLAGLTTNSWFFFSLCYESHISETLDYLAAVFVSSWPKGASFPWLAGQTSCFEN